MALWYLLLKLPRVEIHIPAPLRHNSARPEKFRALVSDALIATVVRQ
jgi:hypothetical protein